MFLPIGIKETCLYVSNLAMTRWFYEKMLGLPVIGFNKERHVFFRAGKSVLLCFLSEATRNTTTLPMHFGSGQLHFAFEVKREEYEATKLYLQQRGIIFEHEHIWPRGHRSIYFRDPDEHCVEIIESGFWD